MHIITVMNYKKSEYITMCKAWLYLAKRFNPNAKITIFYYDDISQIRKFAQNFSKIYLKKLDMRGILKTSETNGFGSYPCQELKLAVWKYVEKYRLYKFLYIEADAFILDSLDTWWRLMEKKPYIAVAEREYKNFKLFNAGPHSYLSKNKFITCNKLIQQYHDDGNQIIYPAGEQGLINAYFEKIKYNCFDNVIDHSYNCIAKKCVIKQVNDTEIIVYSGIYLFSWIVLLPTFVKQIIFKINRLESIYWWRSWFWWNKPKRVVILHSFGGKGFKFWELPECQMLWDYCVSKCNIIEGKIT